MEFKVCFDCGKNKSIDNFHFSRGCRRRTCKACQLEKDKITAKKRYAADPEAFNKKIRERRIANPVQAMLTDYRSFDRVRGWGENDLTKEFIRETTKDGCIYCGETEIRISLDRIDNTKGHLKANVLPCCMRCNFLRGTLPFKAWEHLVPAVRSAREQNLFGDWHSIPLNRKK